MKGIIIIAAGASLVILAAIAGGPVLERNRRAGEIKALRTALDLSRMSADSCSLVLGWEQEEFLRFNGVVDSLRNEVDGYEDPAQGGVPEEVYTEYLATFELYNDSVGVWQDRADSLQAKEGRCRALVESHNQLSDSIRRVQEGWRSGGE
ncbi:MAG: hypothetical protein HKO65_13070 [Gemmatimonadetes bacterium]|nr:hypothetical protein [Gemmatimonadota bacterium]